ncbi:MAG: ABC transporter permease [Caldilineaceae bacterium]|nr:ABC transporter permease [Caldilineaceae bacterium]
MKPLREFRTGDATAAIILPDGYAEQVRNGDPVTIDYYADEPPTGIGPVRQSLEAAVQRVNRAATIQRIGLAVVDELEAADVESDPLFVDENARAAFGEALRTLADQRLNEQGELVAFHVESVEELADGERSADLTGFAQSVPGMGSMFVMFTVLGGMAVLLRERKQWTLQRLMVSPVPRRHILGGKIGAYFSLGMIQYLVVFLFGLLLGQRMGGAPVALLSVMAAFVLCIAGLTFALAPRMGSEEQASSMTTLLALTLAPLGGAWWPLEITPRFMQVIGHLSPVAWAMDGFHTIIIRGGSLNDVLLDIGVLLAASVVLFFIGVRSFR